MVEMMEQLVSARKKSHHSIGDLVTLIKNKATSDDDNSSSDSIVQKIERTEALQKKYEEKIESLRTSKHEIFNGPGTSENKKKRARPLVDEIIEYKKTVKTLKLVITDYRTQLQKAMVSGDNIEVSDESGMESGEE
jgi:hypothetical protein